MVSQMGANRKKKRDSKVLGNFETYTLYSWVADEDKKKGFRSFKGRIAFLISLKGAIC